MRKYSHLQGNHCNGPTGEIQLAWMEQYTKFASLARRD
jgi:replicative DNA helicase